MMDDRLKKQTEFILEADKMKEINRRTYLADGSRPENDAEHSFHLALMACILCEYSTEKLDRAKVMEMVLVHDLVEIDAGDTYAYDTEGYKTKEAREKAAADRIFGILPKDQGREMRALWEEFEEGKTPEAKFANTMDRLQPLLLTDAADGISWKEHGIRKSWVENRNLHTGDEEPALKALVAELIQKNTERGNLINE